MKELVTGPTLHVDLRISSPSEWDCIWKKVIVDALSWSKVTQQ